MKKQVISFTLAIFLGIGLVGCGNVSNADNGSAEEVYYADDDFVNSLSKGLQARWDLTDSEKADNIEDGTEEDSEFRKFYVEAELNEIEHYKDEKFKDSKLQEYVISYINCLNDQIDAIKYITVDYDKFLDKWDEPYDERSKLIDIFAKEYGLTVDEKYQHNLDDFSTNAALVKEEESNEKAVKKLIKKIKFKLSGNDYGYKTYKAVVKNNTGIDFSTIDFSINLLDKDGTIVETAYYHVGNWENDKKAKIEFGTYEDFNSTEVSVTYWEAK